MGYRPHEAFKVSRMQPALCHFVAQHQHGASSTETGRKDRMPKDINYCISKDVQSARLVAPYVLPSGSATFFGQ